MFAAPRSEVRTLVLTDLVESTQLVEALGDRSAADVFMRVDRMTRDLLQTHGGREIDRTDGFLMIFDRPLPAVLFAVELHRDLAALSSELGLELSIRAGVHLGEVVLRENAPEDVARGAKPLEVEGLAKPTAARVMSLAAGGQTLLTRSAFDLARRAAIGLPELGALQWVNHGPYLLKGVAEPVQILEVAAAGRSPRPPADSDKVKRVQVRPRAPIRLATAICVLALILGALAWGLRPEGGPWPRASDDSDAQAAFEAAAEAFRDLDPRAPQLARAAVEKDPDSPLAAVLLSTLTPPTEATAARAQALQLVEGRDDAPARLVRLIHDSTVEREGGVGRDHSSPLAARWDQWLADNPDHTLGQYLGAVYYPVHGVEADFHATDSHREHLDVVALRAFLANHPDWAVARYWLVQLAQMPAEEALPLLDEGLERCPACTRLRVARARALFDQDELELARGELLEALERDQAVEGARELLVDIALRRRDEPERRRLQAAILSPETPGTVRANFAMNHAYALIADAGRMGEGDDLLARSVEILEETGDFDGAAQIVASWGSVLLGFDEWERAEQVLMDSRRWLARVDLSEGTRNHLAARSLHLDAELALLNRDPARLQDVRDQIDRMPAGRLPADEVASLVHNVDQSLRVLRGDAAALDDLPDDACGHLSLRARFEVALGLDPLPTLRRVADDAALCDGLEYLRVGANVSIVEHTEDPDERQRALARIREAWPDADPGSAWMTRIRTAE